MRLYLNLVVLSSQLL